MGDLVVVNHLSIDGVTQGVGRPDEDTREGFQYGGWAEEYADDVLARVMADDMRRSEALLLGRRTYEDFYSFWPNQTDSPYTEVLNTTQKYVVSGTLDEPLPWQNSTLVAGDVVESVGSLRKHLRGNLVVLGSGALVRSLNEWDLVDEYLLILNPLLLGQGRRLFADVGPRRDLSLVDSVVTTTGAIVATYRVRR